MDKHKTLNKVVSKIELIHLFIIGAILVLIFIGITITGFHISYVAFGSILVVMDVVYLIYKNAAINRSLTRLEAVCLIRYYSRLSKLRAFYYVASERYDTINRDQ